MEFDFDNKINHSDVNFVVCDSHRLLHLGFSTKEEAEAEVERLNNEVSAYYKDDKGKWQSMYCEEPAYVVTLAEYVELMIECNGDDGDED